MQIAPIRTLLLAAAVAHGLTWHGGQEADPNSAPPEPPLAKLGDPVADHEFPRLDWHDGRTRLAQLFGHPVLVGGWKQYLGDPYGLNVADAAEVLLGDFADDGLIVILEDRKAWNERRWWGARSFWIRFKENPVWFAAGDPSATRDLPVLREKSERDERSVVLIGVDGTLVFEGTVTESGEGDVGAQLRAAVERELGRRKNGWGDDPHLKKARALAFGAGKFSAALDSADKSKAPQEPVDQVRSEVENAVAAELVSVGYLLEHGRAQEAKDRWQALRRGCRGRDELLAAVDGLAAGFSGKEGKKAQQLGRRLAKILDPMQHDDWRDFDVDVLFDLRDFAAEHPDHPAGRRAARLDPLVKDLAGIARGSHKAIDEAIKRRAEKKGRR